MNSSPQSYAETDTPSSRASSRYAGWLGWAILLVGVVLRVRQYLADRSLWLDEILLSANILDRSLRSLLTGPLDHGQGAPLGFLALERIAVSAVGESAYGLRLVPFLTGLAALPLLLRVARSVLIPPAALVAMALFAFSPSLVFYGAEVKQYGVDAVVALALLGLVLPIGSVGRGRWVALAVGGATAVWLSHPAIFVLAAIAVATPPRRVGSETIPLGRSWWIGLVVVWGVSLGVNYAVHLRSLTANPALLDYWSRGFPPGRLPTPDAFLWLVRSVIAFFRFPAGSFLPPVGEVTHPRMIDLSGVLLVGFVLGIMGLWRHPRRAALLLLPMLLVLVAAWLRSFPFQGRIVLFLAPLAFLVIGEGVSTIWKRSRSTGMAVAALVLLHPVLFAAHGLRTPQLLEETRPLLEYVRDHHRPGDRVYLYYGSVPAFRFYAPRLGMEGMAVIEGLESRTDWRRYLEDLAPLRGGGRTWVVFAHVCNWAGVDEEGLFRQALGSMGRELETRRAPGASVSLYQFPPSREGSADD